MRRLRFLMTAVALAMIIASCSGDSENEAPTTAAQTPTSAGADTTTGDDTGGATASIQIADFAFSGPDSIAAGTTVTVSNGDGVAHTFTSEDDVFDSGSIASGESFQFTFDEAGEYTYFCEFHPQMTGTLTVEG